jgi:hypothetical protein
MDRLATTGGLADAAVGAAPVSPAPPAARSADVRIGFAALLTLGFGLPALFLSAHPYFGICHDGFLYALQALKHLEPQALGGDLYFRYGSQDSLTLFSPLYAALVRLIGLEPAAYLVARTSAVCLCASAWLLARCIAGREFAWLALALFIVVPGRYGANSVFSYWEDFATPRVLTESLVLAALALLFERRRAAALAALGAGFLFHPLMALPGLLVGVLANSSRALRAALTAAGIAVTGAAAAAAALAPIGALRFVDAEWRRVIEEQAPYLFVDRWPLGDWQPTLVTLVTLASAVVALPRGAARQLAGVTLFVSAAGLALAALASTLAPLELLLQGQPWRWLWLGKAVAVLLLAPLAAALWQRGAAGRGALALLAVAWIGVEDPVAVVAALCALLAVLVDSRGRRGWAQVSALLAWLLAGVFACAVWQVNGLLPEAPLVAATVVLWFAVFRGAPAGSRAAAILVAAAFLGVQAAAAISDARRVDTVYPRYDDATYRAFAAWRERIRPEQTVLFAERPAMVWLVLHRPSYGSYTVALYSRDQALATRDRAEQLRRVYEHLPAQGSAGSRSGREPPVTLELLRQLCRIAEIDFVVGREGLPLPRLKSQARAPFDGLYLYACADVRPAVPR